MVNKTFHIIKEWPEEERPREKLLKRGAAALSNTELLAILLRTGVKGESVLDIARLIQGKYKTLRTMSTVTHDEWRKISGLGDAKIAQLKAAFEIGKRFYEEDARVRNIKITSAHAAARILMPRMRDLKTERFSLILLNAQNRLIDIVTVEEGTVNQAHPIVREIFKKALERYASSMICAHNHPSGVCHPSKEDRTFTHELCHAGRIMGITVLDHLIVGDNTFYSFADEGELFR